MQLGGGGGPSSTSYASMGLLHFQAFVYNSCFTLDCYMHTYYSLIFRQILSICLFGSGNKVKLFNYSIILHGRRHLKFAARRRFPNSLVTDLIPMQTRGLNCHLTCVSLANCGCVDIELPSNGSGRHACFKHSNCTSTVDNRESWHRCRDREHKTNLGFLYLAKFLD